MRLNLPRRTKRRVPHRLRQPLVAPTQLNGIWALDFMLDALYGGRRFRTLNVLDDANREALAIEVGAAISASRVIRVLERLVTMYGRPAALRLDNYGPEFTAHLFTDWGKGKEIELRFIQSGKPDQNAFIERFNRTYRDEYNDHRPHSSLGDQTPTEFRLGLTTNEDPDGAPKRVA